RPGSVGGSAPAGLGSLSVPKTDWDGEGGNGAAQEWLEESYSYPSRYVDVTEKDRAKLKAQVARDLAAETGVTEEQAADFVKQWAHSSNDDDMRSLAIQQDAADEFGVELSNFTKDKISSIDRFKERVELKRVFEQQHLDAKKAGASPEELAKLESKLDTEWNKKYPNTDFGYVHSIVHTGPISERTLPLMDSPTQRKLLRAMYNKTQSELAARGITEVRAYRGAKLSEAFTPKPLGKIQVKTNTLSSWSLSKTVAQQFGRGPGFGSIITAVIPTSRIFSFPTTGFGCLREGELVVLGGKNDWVEATEW
ncbi:MAG: hypothetical protein H8E40_11205, partial [Chloroflexi bacterium]|nr:hypothetical protein [Chloroflexota bacterium]